jgi:signal recognition particle subunit SRP54
MKAQSSMFESLSQRLQKTFDSLGKGGKVSEQDVTNAMRDVRMALLEADVALPVVKDFVNRVRERAVGAEVHKRLRPSEQVIKIVHEELIATLGEPGRLNLSGSVKPHVIMMIGLQGSGKTTSAAKLALYLRKEGRQPFLIAADTYRPAAVDQLVTLAKQTNIPYYEEGVKASPPDIVSRGLEAAREANASVVIVDTAGRLQIDETLMRELEEIKQRTNPAEILLVADAMTGQEAVNIAAGFNERLKITGLILTKVDGDARGGAALSMRAVTGVPIKFIGTGEKISLDTLEPFHPDRIADRILGMGDVMSLIERAEQLYEEEEALKLQKKMLENEFTLQDFLEQLRKIRKMGPIGQIMGMIPGMSKLQIQGQLNTQDIEARLKKVEAIICSMTPQERQRPLKILNASRKKRIAAGSGCEVRDVNEVLKQYQQMQNMMQMLRKGKFPKIPGLTDGMGF